MLAKISLLVLATAALAVTQSQPHASNVPKAPPPEIPTVSLCDLLKKPEYYAGKEIRVRAKYYIGFEWSYFGDYSCKEHALETTPHRTANVVWAEFDESVRERTEPGVYEKFQATSSLCCPEGWRTRETEMVVVGEFCYAGDNRYGNGGIYTFQLVVKKVESVGDTKLLTP